MDRVAGLVLCQLTSPPTGRLRSQLAQQKLKQESAGGALILPADHPLAKQAFRNQ
jgi:hypothetical protein